MRRRRVLSLCAIAATSAAAGCSNGGDGGNDGSEDGLSNDLMMSRVRSALEEEGAEVHELVEEGQREVVRLEYSPGGLPADASESEIEARVEETIRAVSEKYYTPIVGPGSGWKVDRLEGIALVDGTVVARFTLVTAWAEECSGTGDTAGCIEQRVQDSVERPQSTDSADASNGTDDSNDSNETDTSDSTQGE